MKSGTAWHLACDVEQILPGAGVAALIEERQIALFRVEDRIHALDNYDPNSAANVLARGLVGDFQGEPVVASPMYKHHFSLVSGRCLEDADRSVNVYPVRIHDGRIWVQSRPARRRARKRRLVVVGNGMAGMKVVEQLLALAPNAYDITVFGAEPHPNYNRMLLSPVLAGEKQVEDIIIHPLRWYREQGVTLHSGDPVISIDRQRRRVQSSSGTTAHYDRLLLATGSQPIMLPIPGKDLPGVVTFRDLQDVAVMLEATRSHTRAVVIGGGLLGLEAAHGLLLQGMDVTVVHRFDTLMERQLDRVAAGLLKASLQQRGLKFQMPADTVAILSKEDAAAPLGVRVGGVQLADGTTLEADLVVMAVGIRPNTELARHAGLHCERGVLVNDTLQTFDPSIYAVGECVQHRNSTYGLVAPLFDQAQVCATHLAELGIGRYAGSLVSTQLKVTGIELFSAGDFVGSSQSETLVLKDAKRGVYKRLVVEGDRIRGAVLYGDVKDGPWYFELMTQQRDVGALRHQLLFGEAFAATSTHAAK